MKKSKIIALVLCVMMVVGALVLASCGGCPGDGECSVSWTKTKNADGDEIDRLKTFTCGTAASVSGDTEDMETSFNCAVVRARDDKGKYNPDTGKTEYPAAECDC